MQDVRISVPIPTFRTDVVIKTKHEGFVIVISILNFESTSALEFFLFLKKWYQR